MTTALVDTKPAPDTRAGLFERMGDVSALSVLRIVLGPVVVVHLWPFLADARAGIYYDDHFWSPYAAWIPRPSGELWALLLWVGMVGAVLMSLGVVTRLSTSVTFVVVAGNLLLSETHFRHNRAFLAILLFGLALLPTGRTRSFDAWWRRRRHLAALRPEALLWPLVMLRVQVSLVYFASGFSKLVDPDWLGGLVLWDRVVRYQHVIHPAPGWMVDFLTWRPLFYVVAPVAVVTELFLAVGLWLPRTRLRRHPRRHRLPPRHRAQRSGRGVQPRGDRRARHLGHAHATRPHHPPRWPHALGPDVGSGRSLPRLAGSVQDRGRPAGGPRRRDGRSRRHDRPRARRSARHRRTTARDVPARSLGPSVRHRTLVATAAVWLVGFGVLRVSLLAPEECPTISEAEAVASAMAAAEWLEAGQRDGRYVYEYDRTTGQPAEGYNLVRHAGVTMSLYQLAAAGADDALGAADEGTDFMLDRLEPAGDGLALVDRGSSSARVGASALMVAALLDRRAATGDERYDSELRALGRFLAGQVEPSGRVSSDYDLAARAPIDQTSRYATGEAAWALARLHTTFPTEDEWDAAARAVAEYLATERDDAEDVAPQPWPDQWAAYLLAELAPSGLSAEQATYARRLAERFGLLVRTESQKDGWPTPFIDAHARRRPRGLGRGRRVPRPGRRGRPSARGHPPALEERLACGAGLLAERQVSGGPPEEAGAWFREDVTRMDDQQHALTGLLGAFGLLERSR